MLKLAGKGIRISDISGQSRCYVKNLKLCENWLGKVSEILKPLDTLLPKKHEIGQKLAKESIRYSYTSGYAVTSKNMKLCEKWLGRYQKF